MNVKESCTDVLTLLKSHASVRKYKQEDIPLDTLKNMLNAAQHAASSNFVQAYSVVLVKDEAKKREIGILSNNQPQINSAPVLLLFCADMKRLEYATLKKQASLEHGTAENFIVSVMDTALFAQNFVVAAESSGYGICFIGGVRNKPEEIGNLVDLPDKTIPLFGMTVGVPDEQQMVKPRLPVEAILHVETYDESKYQKIINEYDATIADYYKKRLTNNKDSDWSGTMSAFLSERRREHMKSFLAKKGFYFE
jgi:FMN reductase (NADPH)